MWEKQGLIYQCDEFNTGYAQDPFVDVLSERVWRIYYTARTEDNVSLPFYIDVEAGNPSKILARSEGPLFLPGPLGSFDENGITMTSILDIGDEKYLYYCGWNKRMTTPYALSIGIVSVKENSSYCKLFEGPVLDRNKFDPIAVSAPMVIKDEGSFKMWYITFTEWLEIEGRLEPVFVIKMAESIDGLNWEVNNHICINSTYPGESFARPWVTKTREGYRMFFSSRGPTGYRDIGGQHYMLEEAYSIDGINWKRRSESVLGLSDSGWDSEMISYGSSCLFGNREFLLYNGNYFGKAGFGYASRNV